jgi:hypothetical protein
MGELLTNTSKAALYYSLAEAEVHQPRRRFLLLTLLVSDVFKFLVSPQCMMAHGPSAKEGARTVSHMEGGDY